MRRLSEPLFHRSSPVLLVKQFGERGCIPLVGHFRWAPGGVDYAADGVPKRKSISVAGNHALPIRRCDTCRRRTRRPVFTRSPEFRPLGQEGSSSASKCCRGVQIAGDDFEVKVAVTKYPHGASCSSPNSVAAAIAAAFRSAADVNGKRDPSTTDVPFWKRQNRHSTAFDRQAQVNELATILRQAP